MRLGVSSYSFAGALKAGRLALREVPALAAEIGFDEIEFIDFGLEEGADRSAFARELKRICADAGITIGNYTIAADFLGGSGGDLDAEIERLKGELQIAAELGSPGMRHDAAWGIPSGYPHHTGFDDVLPRLVEGCRRVTEYAATLGIRTMVENHGYFAQDSDRVERLVRAVAHENFGLLVDMGNFLCADEIPSRAVGKLLPYAFHIHAKDFHVKSGMEPDPGAGWFQSRAGNYLRGAVVGHGNADIFQCFRIIKKSGYDGTLSLEFEGIEQSETGITFGFNNMKRFLDMIES